MRLTFRGRDLPIATAGVEQNSPTFTPGVPNLDFSLTTAISQLATSWQPAAVARPCTLAMMGTGSLGSKVMTWRKNKGEKSHPELWGKTGKSYGICGGLLLLVIQ